MNEVLLSVVHFLTFTAALAAGIFVVSYTRSPWRRNPAGRNTMAFMAVVALTLTTAVVFRMFDKVLPLWLASVIWFMINWPLWWRVVILWKAQRHKYDVEIVPPHTCTACGSLCKG